MIMVFLGFALALAFATKCNRDQFEMGSAED